MILIGLAGTVRCNRDSSQSDPGENPDPSPGPVVLATKMEFISKSTPDQIALIRKFIALKNQRPVEKNLPIRYPNDGSVFPPEIVAPALSWDNPGLAARKWLIEFTFQDSGKISVLIPSHGPIPFIIDREINPEDKELPLQHPVTQEDWMPGGNLWNFIKGKTVGKFCQVSVTGFKENPNLKPILSGGFRFKTSEDPVGAPIFYRDVPFIPVLQNKAESILPLDGINMKYIRWRLRDIARAESKVIMKDMPTCANCHTFSRDGKKLGMDIDGTQGDKGAYGIQKVSRQMVYNRSDLVSWNYDFKGKRDGKTIGFMASIAPDGDFVVTTVNEKLYTVGYRDPTFSQVFYPTRGILAYYSQATKVAKGLPGADDPEYVQCSPTWTPDGKYIIFSRAKAKDPFTLDQKMPAKANDSEETAIQYDLYKIPFNGGLGGKAVPILGASFNGKSNNFAKVTPNNKFIVWVQCRNGLLMRPDSKLWMVPVEGGIPRLMNCNTSRMNSWHSFSPNSRWMVFSSKEFSPYTQLFLTHLNEDGSDSPFILLPNSTADNRAANLPEFANINYDDLDNIDVPAVSHYRYQVQAEVLFKAGAIDSGIKLLRKALDEEKKDRAVRADIIVTLSNRLNNPKEVIQMYQEAIRNDPNFSQIYFDMGQFYEKQGNEVEAIAAYKKCLDKDPSNPLAMIQLTKLYMTSQNPAARNLDQAFFYALRANKITYNRKPYLLENLARVYSEKGRFKEAVETARMAIQRALDLNEADILERLNGEATAFEENRKFTSLITRNKI